MSNQLEKLPSTKTVFVLLLIIFTYWIYSVWWYYSRFKALKDETNSHLLIIIGVYALALMINIPYFYWGSFLVYIALHFYLAFSFKSEIESVLYEVNPNNYQLSTVLSLSGSVVYFQYVINKSKQGST